MSRGKSKYWVWGFAGMLALAASTDASFHIMQIEQVIGGVNGDTNAQAIQLRLRALGQNLLAPARMRAFDATGANPVIVVNFAASVPNSAAGARVLITSAGFATYTSPAVVNNFTMSALIPGSYLPAGSLTFEDDSGLTVYWRLSWGGAGYTGSNTGSITNDADGNFGPPFGSALPSTTLQALRFNGIASAMSTNNAADYSITAGAATFNNNAGTAFVVTAPTSGACCHTDDGTCQDGVAQSSCTGTFRQWTDSVLCANLSPPCEQLGACCDTSNATCTNLVAQSNCVGANLTWTGGVLCANLIPACQALGACCDHTDGTCLDDVPQTSCSAAFLEWTAATDCASLNPICEITGACCDASNGTCTDGQTQSQCTGPLKTWTGAALCANLNPPCEMIEASLSAIGLQLVVSGLISPVQVAAPNDGTGRLFIVDQAGFIRVVDSSGNLLPAPFLDLTGVIPSLNPAFDERGVLGLALHPNYSSNGRFFVRYSLPRAGNPGEPCLDDTFINGCHEEVLAEYNVLGDPATSNTADSGSEIILYRVDKPQWNHNAGGLAFGPDGYLYFAYGDGGGAHDGLADVPPSHGPIGSGQNIETALGKVLRIDVDSAPTPPLNYAIPPTNPFVGVAGLDEIYAYGFRNPYKLSFDDGPGGDGALYVGDVGQDLYEEVDVVELGGNYGWSVREAAHCFDPFNPGTPPLTCSSSGLIDPVVEYEHSAFGLAVVGGFVNRGDGCPGLSGKYIYGDFSMDFGPTGRLYYFDTTGPEAFVHKEFFLAPSGQPFGHTVKGFGRDEAGEIYVCGSIELGPTGTTGVVYRITAPPSQVEAVGSRYLAITPPESSDAFALVVRPSCPGGVTKYVGAPSGALNVAQLVDNPINAAYLDVVGWGHTVNVIGAGIVPNQAYEVYTDCGIPGDGFLSPASVATTWKWGDADNNTFVNLDDILCELAGFGGSFTMCSPYSTDFQGQTPNRSVDLDDILAVLAAFGGAPYPHPLPCP